MRLRSGNPALTASTFAFTEPGAQQMTLTGTVQKTLILLVIVIGTGAYTWAHTTAGLADVGARTIEQVGRTNALSNVPSYVFTYVWGGCIGGLVMALATIFKKTWSPVTAPMYAAAEGVALGALSAMFEYMYPGIVAQAVGLTFGVLVAMLGLYLTQIIKPTENFKIGVVSATGAIALFYLVSIIARFAFHYEMPMIHETGAIGIGFSVVVVVLAALNLVIDFDFIEQGAARGAPKYMEWYGAFGLLVTLVWLYMELLRLLAKVSKKR